MAKYEKQEIAIISYSLICFWTREMVSNMVRLQFNAAERPF